MDEIDVVNLDTEFQCYLKIMRPYLGQLVNLEVIQICKAWIQRLSNCSNNEKLIRNKYVSQLCYQLSKGELYEPFTNYPPEESLHPICEGHSEDSTEEEYIVINGEEPDTMVLFNNKKPILSETEYFSQDFDNEKKDQSIDSNSRLNTPTDLPRSQRQQTILCYNCPEIKRNVFDGSPEQIYEYRANNLVLKLREIKKQNMLLQNEILSMKETPKSQYEEDIKEEIKVDIATSAYTRNESLTTLKSLEYKIKEVEEIKHTLITTITNLQEQLDSFNEIKKHEINDIEAKHKLEIIRIKAAVREESNEIYGNIIKELKEQYESKIQDLEHNFQIQLQNLNSGKHDVINEKDKIIEQKNTEIECLKTQLDEQKTQLNSMFNKINEKTEEFTAESRKSQELEKRLSKLEKSKAKCTKTLESKLAYLQREKHLAECSLQLQLVRQRAQVINEIADDNQTELSSALEKLESKYKDIVANMQATAIQRRMQDQIALEAILQAACNTQNETSSANHSQFTGKTVTTRNQAMRDGNQSYDSDASGLLRHKVPNKFKCFGDDSMTPGFCLDGERLGELFDKVYIPQRDTGDGSAKKPPNP